MKTNKIPHIFRCQFALADTSSTFKHYLNKSGETRTPSFYKSQETRTQSFYKSEETRTPTDTKQLYSGRLQLAPL